jgi:uncharacterized repeat protein (TIGR03803 family)
MSSPRSSFPIPRIPHSIAVLALLVTASVAHAQEKVLASFSGTNNGSQPHCILVMDAHGNLYGTTPTGGDENGGLVFALGPDGHGGWNEKTIYSFDTLANGLNPNGGLVLDSVGNLYGTTTGGGANTLGTAFELSPTTGGGWTETVIHSFGATGDGIFPYAQMILDAAGNLYGTTAYGGAFGTGEEGGGTVFEISPQTGGGWSEQVVHSFASGHDGVQVAGGVALDAAGNLYGATFVGGTHGEGIIYELSPQTGGDWMETILHNFTSGTSDGRLPMAGVTLDAAGNVYGTTSAGGPYERGIAFKLAPLGGGVWSFSGLHAFGNGLDGANPEGEVVFDAAGNLYGTTYDGGKYGQSFGGTGTFYELSPAVGGAWTEPRLYSFGGTNRDATFPQAGLIIDSRGIIYGTSTGGGQTGNGAVFEVKP